MTPQEARPVLRWVGGKSWFVKDHGASVAGMLTRTGGKYIEPFLGGGSMALYLGAKKMVLGDIERDLITMYTVVRDHPNELHDVLEALEEIGTGEEHYYLVRDSDTDTPIERAAKLIYLNRLCFNGLYRKNKKGIFNVPYGKKQKAMPTFDSIKAASTALQGAEISSNPFGKIIMRATRGDVVYADPPYDETFADYSAHGFGDAEQEHLAIHLKLARERGAQVLCHNSDTPFIRDLYEWAEIVPMKEKRSINSDGEKREPVACVLIVGADE